MSTYINMNYFEVV